MPKKDQSLPVLAPKGLPAVHSYAELRDAVKATLLRGLQRIEAETLRTHWEIGQLIRRFLLNPDGRADFGKRVISRLARDLEVSRALLYQTVRFAKNYPIVYGRTQLTWSHYRALLSVPNKKERKTLEDQAVKYGWSEEDLIAHIKTLRAKKRDTVSRKQKVLPILDVPERGSLFTYRVVGAEKVKPDEASLWLDLGFAVYRKIAVGEVGNLSVGDIVTAISEQNGTFRFEKVTVASEKTEKDPPDSHTLLYTYKAYVERVVDGDTLRVQIDLGFGQRIRQYLRLRGVDAPEIQTPLGRRAKRFVESKLGARSRTRVPVLTARTSRPEKYDRYLADVFYGKKDFYLNQELLNAGLADRAGNSDNSDTVF